MKINPAGTPTVATQNNTAKKVNGDFKAILQEEKARIGMSHMPDTASVPPNFLPLSPIVDLAQKIHAVDTYVSLLEEYERALADNTVTLKDMAPVVRKLADETERMKPFLDSLASNDGLRPILNRALVTATVETIKFNRGDYID